ncbi:PH domain-containing protein [Actinospica durhamensis]|uniref:PH domain-containing protein n=1 Tax=Actinospica durhamensis TaxID=1508375 RepID=A0A941EPB8_9ACTN|nr:PH domain-containing protein [Actinospica durhamensis]MBR7834063.1 PH domain-containing protein [Actinospica durhamensis]
MTSPATSPQSAEKPTVYRGLGALIGGALVTLFCLGGAIDLLVEEGSADIIGASILFLVATLAFAYGVFPAAFAHEDRLVVRNPMRTISVPWSAVTNLTAKLSFIVHTEQTRYTVWAVPVSLRDRRKVERARLRERTRQQRAEGRPQRVGGYIGYGAPFGSEVGPRRRGGGIESIDRLSFADQAVSEMNERIMHWNDLQHGRPAAGASAAAQPKVTVRPNVATIAPVVAALVFLIVAVIVH